MSTTKIDDRDSSVVYTGSWQDGGTSHEFDSTVKYTNTVGDSFELPFTGTQIEVFGTYDASSGGVVTSYAVDGNATQVTSVASASGNDVYQSPFWTSASLPQGSHKLVVKMIALNPQDDGDGEGTIWFDYFLVTSGSSSTLGSGSTSATTTTGSATSSTATSLKASKTKSADSTATTAITAATTNKSSNHSGVIAGAIIAMIALLAIAALFLYNRRRRSQNRSGSQDAFEKFFKPSTASGAAASTSFIPPSNGAPYDGVNASPHGSFPGGPQMAIAASSAPLGFPQPQYGNQPRANSPSGPPPGAFPVRFDQYSAVPPSSGRPSLDATSMTSSTGYGAPSRQFLYVHNDNNVLTYNAPGTTKPGTPTKDGDSIAELKRRQQEAVANYNEGISQGAAPIVQHVDSGVRSVNPVQAAVELPPVYTPA